jgi:hypothetical protein
MSSAMTWLTSTGKRNRAARDAPAESSVWAVVRVWGRGGMAGYGENTAWRRSVDVLGLFKSQTEMYCNKKSLSLQRLCVVCVHNATVQTNAQCSERYCPLYVTVSYASPNRPGEERFVTACWHMSRAMSRHSSRTIGKCITTTRTHRTQTTGSCITLLP